MLLNFTKMQGLGNDFIVIDAVSHPVTLTAGQIRFLSDRHFGVGCDQLLIIEPAHDNSMDFFYRIFNADGGEVEQCGNGARCFVRYVHDKGLTHKTDIIVGTISGNIHPRIEADGRISVDMGVPRFVPQDIPFVAEKESSSYSLEVVGEKFDVGVVSVGNPHVVIQVEDVEHAPVGSLGPVMESHARFPRRVNVGFMQVVDRNHIRLRVYERGVGETLACGSGACAATVIGARQGLLDDNVSVELPGGSLLVHWSGGEETVRMTGPASHVFEGKIEL
jgi:diaminopimelate epimerase